MVLNLALRFILEICALIAVGYWGFQTGQGFFGKWLLGLGGPIFIAVIWGMLGSPAAPFPVEGWVRLLLEILIFGLAVLGLFFSSHQNLAMIFAVLVVLNIVLMHVWEQ